MLAYKELDDLRIYMDYFITHKILEAQVGSVGNYFWNYEDFKNKKAAPNANYVYQIDHWKSKVMKEK